jgi:hypothetical protein
MIWDSKNERCAVFGGFGPPDSHEYNASDKLFYYYPSNDSWVKINEGEVKGRHSHMIFNNLKDEKIIIVGGMGPDKDFLGDLWSYDEVNGWIQGAGLDFNLSNSDGFYSSIDNSIYIFFGQKWWLEGSNSRAMTMNKYYKYNIDLVEWEELGEYGNKTYVHSVVWDDNKAIIFGGLGQGTRDRLLIYRPYSPLPIEGYLESSTYDANGHLGLGNITWESEVTPDTFIKFQIASSNEISPTTWRFYGPDGTENTFYNTSGQNISNIHSTDRYLRYKIYLSSNDKNASCILKEVTISQHIYFEIGNYLSPIIDINTSISFIDEIITNAQIPDNTSLSIEIRSGSSHNMSDAGPWELYPPLNDTPNNRYFQFKIIMHTNDTLKSPSVEIITLKFDTKSNLSNDYVNPEAAPPGDFTFGITYIDLEGEEAKISKVVIDGDEYQMVTLCSTFEKGCLYTAEISLEMGNHSYHFEFSDDGSYVIRYPQVGEIEGPLMTMPPIGDLEVIKSTISVGEEIGFDMSGSSDPDGKIVSYHLDFGDNTNITTFLPAAIHTYTKVGNYTVTLEVVDELNAHSAPVTLTIEVLPINKLPVAILNASSSKIQINKKITLDASQSYDPDGSIIAYFFDFGDGKNSSWIESFIISHEYNSSDKYQITVSVKDNRGAIVTSDSFEIEVVKRSNDSIFGIITFEIIILIIGLIILLLIVLLIMKKRKK